MISQGRRATRPATCAVTYRATMPNGEEAEIRLALDPSAATLADAWARLSARYGRVDPRSIEIELREPVAAAT
jgi:hypothetical protein